MQRRELLALVGAGLLAGCEASEPSTPTPPRHRRAADAWDLDRTTDEGGTTLSGTVTLPRGTYAMRPLEPEQRTRYEFEIGAGEAVDALTLPSDQYENRYRDGTDGPGFLPTLSEPGVLAATVEGQLPPGSYVFVLDNTPVYGANAGRDVEVDVTLRIE